MTQVVGDRAVRPRAERAEAMRHWPAGLLPIRQAARSEGVHPWLPVPPPEHRFCAFIVRRSRYIHTEGWSRSESLLFVIARDLAHARVRARNYVAHERALTRHGVMRSGLYANRVGLAAVHPSPDVDAYPGFFRFQSEPYWANYDEVT